MGSKFLNEKGADGNRCETISIIQDFLNKNTTDHFIEFLICNASEIDNMVDWRKQLIDLGYMSRVVSDIRILARYLEKFETDNPDKVAILKEIQREIEWSEKQFDIIEDQETKGDYFGFVYYDDKNKCLKIKHLDSEKMTDIFKDPSTDEITGYLYKQSERFQEFNPETFQKYSVTKPVEYYFERGRYYKKVNGVVLDSYENRDSYKDEIPIIHIPALKEWKDNEGFSEIPAVDYIDVCLWLMANATDKRLINKLTAYPIPIVTDGDVNADESIREAGGIIKVESDDPDKASGYQAKVDIMQVTNGLETLENEKADFIDFLYGMAGLIKPNLELKLGSSDSSRVVSQLRLKLELKYKKYLKNIVEKTQWFWMSALQEKNKKYKKKDPMVKLEMPEITVNSSIFDEILLLQQKLQSGLTDVETELAKDGLTKKQINERKNRINQDVFPELQDLSINNQIQDTALNGSSSEQQGG